jgi:hemerythrin
MITWDDSMMTGLPKLDVQHQELIEKYNELAIAITNTSGSGRAAAGELLDFLQFYVIWHFGFEENCMEKYRCPVAERNKRAHAQFVARFRQFYTQWQQRTMDLNLMQSVYIELGKWIENHIRRLDTQISLCITDHDDLKQ